ncbi:Glutamate--glyoxylate aminotransferase 2 [Sesamum angolense]|uniref:Glutamate--glyoxylate aminotransferase 2 n=1 Tax=Sesamum angolense TaxID=2727404 RepID=A0AAE2BZ35_9LAMI|nr:Glutamate--glyoxylate aminotransferase 2 [Sesamum angolense]
MLSEIIFTNVGNPHALGQKPLTFPRQVVALCQAPFLLDDPNVGLIFPADAIAKAKHYLAMTSGGLGAYSDSRGLPGIRKEVAEFIERRDGYPSDPELIFLTDGASKGVMQILSTIIRGAHDGVRAMVIINPGNPTGQCLSEANLREVLKLCRGDIQSCFDITESNVPAQIFMGLMVNPLKPGDISYERYIRESKGILESLRRRAQIMTDGFNSCRNVVCNFTEGAMYSFPQIRLPPKAIEAAKQAGKVADVFYCLKLLEATGISTVPGSGFGQKEGVFHLRTTILPAEEDMPAIMASFKKFNDEFMEQYEDHRGYSRIDSASYLMLQI